jgi:hypothetical protein
MNTGEWIVAVGVVTLIACVVQVITGQSLTGLQWVSVVKDLATGAAALLASYIAWRGLSTWERQLKGNAEFECARALARATYTLRDAIGLFRAPALLQHEFSAAYLAQREHSPEETSSEHAAIYNKRWEPLSEVAREFDLRALEAEAIWGPEVQARCRALKRLLVELSAAVASHVDNLRMRGPQDAEHLAWSRQIARIVDSIGADNPFSGKVETTVTAISELLKPHLRWIERTAR